MYPTATMVPVSATPATPERITGSNHPGKARTAARAMAPTTTAALAQDHAKKIGDARLSAGVFAMVQK